jgi:hypothetical protein
MSDIQGVYMPVLFGKEWPPKSLLDSAARGVEFSTEEIESVHELCRNGYYDKEKLGVHVGYSVIGMCYADRAFSLYVLGKERSEFMPDLKQATAFNLKSLDVLRNPANPEYNKKYDVPGKYFDHDAMEDIYCAILGDDFSAAKTFAGGKWAVSNPGHGGNYLDGLTQTRNNEPRPIFLKGLVQFILGNPDESIKTISPLMETMEKRGLSKNWTYRKNYYSLLRALYGILTHDEEKVTSGISMQLNFYEHSGANPHSEYYGLSEYYICQPAAVLAILALKAGIDVNIEHALLPELFMDKRT